jgi:outer membrane protein assembly factor BamB
MRFASCLVVLALTLTARAGDWPAFLGPNADSSSPETHLIHAFGPAGPTVLWTVPVGPGFGGPAVRDGQVFLLDRDGTKKENNQRDVLRCLDLATGKQLWTYAYPAPGTVDFAGSRSTPAVDDHAVYTIGTFGQVHCVDRTTHKPVWSMDLLKDFGGSRPQWGVALSPVLFKDWVIVAPQSKTVGVAAIDKITGKVVWKSAPIGDMAYCTPVITTIDGVAQAIVQNGSGAHSVDLATGQLLWSCDFNCQIPVPVPTPIGDGRLFITEGYNAGCAMFRIGHQAGAWTATALWRLPRQHGAQIHRALLIDQHLYVLANSNEAKEGLVCLDLDGHQMWRAGPSNFLDKGNFLYADGLLWSMDGESGELRIIQPDPAAYKELASAKLLTAEGKMVWGPMAISDGRLLARDQHQLKCVDLRPAN